MIYLPFHRTLKNNNWSINKETTKQDVMLSQAQHDNGVIVYLSESKKNDINSAVSVNSLNTAEKIK